MNRAILMGRLCKEPELRFGANSSTAVCKFTIAVDRRFQKQGEEKQADFINCVAFGKTGEFISKYFSKGSKIAVVGSIQTRNWDDAEGKKHYVTEVVVEEAYFAEGKKDGQQPVPQNDGNEFYPVDDDDELPF